MVKKVQYTDIASKGNEEVGFWGRILVTIYGAPHRRFLEFFSVSAILVNFKMRNSPKF